MSGPHEVFPPGSPRDWIEHARSDLALARLGRDSEDVLPAQVCFHAQQAVEKALKAVLLYQGIAFPLTHDLEALIEIMTNAGMELPDWSDDVSGLNPYAVEARYPGRPDDIGTGDMDEALELARGVIDWARVAIATR
jgi:HEPN domain-containing protein